MEVDETGCQSLQNLEEPHHHATDTAPLPHQMSKEIRATRTSATTVSGIREWDGEGGELS